VSDLPLRFAIDGNIGRVEQSARTGADGKAAARMHEVGKSEAKVAPASAIERRVFFIKTKRLQASGYSMEPVACSL
jgi:hypothetical protein